MATLFAGPWVGEFGWELFCWQGYLRKISSKFDRVIVSSRPGHRCLYEDFCNEYVEYVPHSQTASGPNCYGFSYNNIHTNYIDEHFKWVRFTNNTAVEHPLPEKVLKEKRDVWIPPQSFLIPYSPLNRSRQLLRLFNDQMFIAYGCDSPDNKYDLIIHARNIQTENKRKGGTRNWSRKNWNELLSAKNGETDHPISD